MRSRLQNHKLLAGAKPKLPKVEKPERPVRARKNLSRPHKRKGGV